MDFIAIRTGSPSKFARKSMVDKPQHGGLALVGTIVGDPQVNG